MLRTIKFILNHPFAKNHRFKAFAGFIKWQLSSRISSKPVVYKFTKNSKLWVWKGLTGATGNIYCGLHEFEDMAFLLHMLRPHDMFMDVGANIGSYTILASAEIGAKSIAVEPVPQTFHHLKENIQLNQISKLVTALNIGLGSKKDILKFTRSYDTGNHVATDNDTDVIDVNVETLDGVLTSIVPLLIKIDVEGFETEVLKGGMNTLSSPGLKAIIIELNGAGVSYGFNDDNIHDQLIALGFKVMDYDPLTRVLKSSERKKEHNTLYIRDVEFLKERLKSANPVYVKGRPL
ncbi:FkbM family methyltransferase [Mucilaginibacter sp. 21P]|uniref:FkbM family methyltransferase n=1 Tax=Mucilaginibacter sp. 21P TaxID=2778902 RepID=UPI001C56D724|nr:FkbM family methyltransferase [Mucilaginibacter sp. 21P]QXV65524.1 FkbM family methyltransferase [Mucilaginibacter sp. 21P]